MRNHPTLEKLIPETALRNLYWLLRDFPSQEFHLALTKELIRVPQRLDELLERSFRHFSHYKNEEAFHSRGKNGDPTTDRQQSTRLADQFTVEIFKQKNIKIQGNLSFDYVDYDISPLRTTGNPGFESGESSRSSGTGGVDLLLSNAEEQFPIVGEIKAEKDATPLLALIQALTYAIELATPSQRIRLQSIYPGRFKFVENGPSIDIYLLLVSPPGDDGAKDFLMAVGSLCQKLIQLKFTPTVIRKIVCLQTEYKKSGGGFTFETNFCWMK